MSRLAALLLLLACAILEIGGDALVRKGIHTRDTAARWGLYMAGAALLFAYGWLVNRPGWSFGSLMGIYVVLFFVVAQVLAFALFGEKMTASLAGGGALVVTGGLIIALSK